MKTSASYQTSSKDLFELNKSSEIKSASIFDTNAVRAAENNIFNNHEIQTSTHQLRFVQILIIQKAQYLHQTITSISTSSFWHQVLLSLDTKTVEPFINYLPKISRNED